jgi:hypothetical protein
MKKLLLSFVVLVSVFTTSCKKEEKVTPQDPIAPKTINVEYRIQCESGNVNVNYLAPNTSGVMEMQSETMTRTSSVVNFNFSSGHLFSVEASNVAPSHKVVQVQIYIDNVLFKEGSTTNPSVPAIAQGNY